MKSWGDLPGYGAELRRPACQSSSAPEAPGWTPKLRSWDRWRRLRLSPAKPGEGGQGGGVVPQPNRVEAPSRAVI